MSSWERRCVFTVLRGNKMKPLSSGGSYRSEWKPESYYNPVQDGFCPGSFPSSFFPMHFADERFLLQHPLHSVFPDPYEKNASLKIIKMKKEHIPDAIAVEKDFHMNNEFIDQGVAETVCSFFFWRNPLIFSPVE